MAAGGAFAALGLGSGLFPALGGVLLSVVVGIYTRRFLANKIYAKSAPEEKAHADLQWEIPELSEIQVTAWREQLQRPCTMSPQIQQMLSQALK